MTNRSDLVRAITAATDGQQVARAVAALDAFERERADRASAEREVDLGARIASARLTPVALHEHHTAATDWLSDYEPPAPADYRVQMIAQASAWYRSLDPGVRADAGEFSEQARGRARVLASSYGSRAPLAQVEFLQAAAYLRSQGASGLPQIDQLIDPNNQPAATPYPEQVFPTFGEEQDPFNGVEDNAHGSQAASTGAPLLQQVMQQNAGGSGYGTGPERPDGHSTGFDTTDSYAEVPLGAPGVIPTAGPGQGPSVPSSPNPVAGTPQDAGAGQRRVAAIDGYSLPDPFGYRWAMQREVMHPFHERCGSAHWPDERCGDREHTASVAVGYVMNIDQARRTADCERLGVREGLRAVAASGSAADLGTWHNRVTAGWGNSDRTADDSAVLHGFMAVVRPVLAEMATEGATRCEACRGRNCGQCSGNGCTCGHGGRKTAASGLAAGGVTKSEREHATHHLPGPGDKFPVDSAADVENAKHDVGRTSEPKAKVRRYINEMAEEYGVPKLGEGGHAKAASAGREPNFTEPPLLREGPRAVEAASGLPQVQQVTDPNNVPTPDADQLPEGVAFPLGDSLGEQWVTSPDGPRPKARHESARKLPAQGARLLGHADAMEGRQPTHKDEFGHSKIQHGRYLSGWNETAGLIHGLVGRAPMSAGEYGRATGRPDLHGQYIASYAEGRKMHAAPGALYSDEGGQTAAGLRRQADAWSQPRQTTDDLQAPYNSAATTPPMTQGGPDYSAGLSAGRADRAAGERPAFADASSAVSPYVKGYSEGYSAAQAPAQPQDVPYSAGGDSGQGANAQQAATSFQVARASRVASLRRVSAAFAPEHLMADPDFRKGYLFALKWRRGARLVSTGSARFEAGLYAGITDNVRSQGAWVAAHLGQARRSPGLRRRLDLHASFTVKQARRTGARYSGAYLRSEAGTSTDLITDGPGTSPDPMGATPINGPGTPPPMGGLADPAAAGGAPPYQGAPPLPGGPVAPDDVMGRAQQRPQPDGPFTQTFSGQHPENASLAPVAPNPADQPGYSGKEAYNGDPRGGDRVASRLAAFRARVQEGLAVMASKGGSVYDYDPETGLPREGFDYALPEEPPAPPPQRDPESWERARGYDMYGRPV